MSKQTQAHRILALLKSRPEVPAPELAAISLQYCSRLCELRRSGHNITNRTETVKGVRHGYYRLERGIVSNHSQNPSPPAPKQGGGEPNALFSAAQLSGCSREVGYPD